MVLSKKRNIPGLETCRVSSPAHLLPISLPSRALFTSSPHPALIPPPLSLSRLSCPLRCWLCGGYSLSDVVVVVQVVVVTRMC